MTRLRVLFLTLLLLGVCSACSENTSGDAGNSLLAKGYVKSPFVESITLMRDDSGSVGARIAAPKPQDNPFHAVVRVRKGERDIKVTVDLVAVDAGGEQNKIIMSQNYDLLGLNDQADVKFAVPQDWPTGRYRIDTYIYKNPSKSKAFTIQ